MNLIKIARELLYIKEVYLSYLDYNKLKEQKIKQIYDDDFDLYYFEQTWGNTSGGFEEIGGSAMTNQNTYILVPKFDHDILVFFGSRFAYKVPYSKKFMEDVKNQSIKGKKSYNVYLKQE